jgi:hypothetical protein
MSDKDLIIAVELMGFLGYNASAFSAFYSTFAEKNRNNWTLVALIRIMFPELVPNDYRAEEKQKIMAAGQRFSEEVATVIRLHRQRRSLFEPVARITSEYLIDLEEKASKMCEKEFYEMCAMLGLAKDIANIIWLSGGRAPWKMESETDIKLVLVMMKLGAYNNRYLKNLLKFLVGLGNQDNLKLLALFKLFSVGENLTVFQRRCGVAEMGESLGKLVTCHLLMADFCQKHGIISGKKLFDMCRMKKNARSFEEFVTLSAWMTDVDRETLSGFWVIGE